MPLKIGLNEDGIVSSKKSLPVLNIHPVTKPAKRLVNLHRLLTDATPHICIVRGEGIGDLLMTTPVAKFLYHQYPGIKITYATNLNYLDGALPKVLKYNPYIEDVVDWNFYDEDKYDAVLNLHCPCVKHEVPKAKPIHRIELFARYLGINKLEDTLPVYRIAPPEAENALEHMSLMHLPLHGKTILLQPYASNSGRSLSSSILKDTINLLIKSDSKLTILAITHDSDFDHDIDWGNIPGVISLHNYDVREIAAIMTFCDLVLCPDSAILHLTAALNIPAVALFGPTDYKARTNLYPKAKAIAPGATLGCQPCWYAWGNCKHFTCWKLITPQDIVTQCQIMLERYTKASPQSIIDNIYTKFSYQQKNVIKAESL